jgi:L-fuconolactonase
LDIVDSHIHTWKADDPSLPWDHAWGLEGPSPAATLERMAQKTVPYEEAIGAMDGAGVAGALAVSHRLYGFDNSYVLEAARNHPNRFKAVGLFDYFAADLSEQVKGWADLDETAGIRITLTGPRAIEDFRSGAMDGLFAEMERNDVPLFCYPPGLVTDLRDMVERFGDLKIVFDHFVLRQPPFHTADAEPWAALPDLLPFARYENVFVKASALPILSAQPFPFNDIWPHIHAVVSAFGIERMMWGSDFTRVAGSHTYEEAVDYIRETDELSSAEKEMLFAGTARQIVEWQ